jgi:transcriptional regulator with XRE-family HTH domain
MMKVDKMYSMSEFSQWLRDKYIAWEKTNEGGIQGITKFSDWLGIKQPYISAWINGDYKPGAKYIGTLAKKLGVEVYEILGFPRPDDLPYDLPGDFRGLLQQAVSETREELRSRGLSPDSKEAEQVAIEVFERHGFKYIRTENPDGKSG